MSTREGYKWTEKGGLQAGLPCLGSVEPKINAASESVVYDAIVVGAGYTGLTAARDLTATGHKVLLLEARDRIGGRTWSSNLGDYPFEMGGTWVHWFQPMVYREIARYGMAKDLESSHDFSRGLNCHELVTPQGRKTMSHDEEVASMERAIKRFVNVDGEYGKRLIPFPQHDPHHNPEVFKYDQMSFADRFREIEDDLSPTERANFEGFLSITSGGSMEDSSFFEFIRWWALNNWNINNFFELCLTYKFKSGQSSFARKFFVEAAASQKLSWKFDCLIAMIEDIGSCVLVTNREGQKYKARRVICTVPLNMLHKISFGPPLSAEKMTASRLGHCNKVSKVHVECANPELRSFSATAYPHNKLTYVFGDGTTPAGNTHLVAFGSSLPGVHLQPEEDREDTISAFQEFAPMNVRRIAFHNWTKDEFADGAWEFLKPDSIKYISALREKQGNIVFASADWAIGWRGFIDGAIEDGTRAAMDVQQDLQELYASKL